MCRAASDLSNEECHSTEHLMICVAWAVTGSGPETNVGRASALCWRSSGKTLTHTHTDIDPFVFGAQRGAHRRSVLGRPGSERKTVCFGLADFILANPGVTILHRVAFTRTSGEGL